MLLGEPGLKPVCGFELPKEGAAGPAGLGFGPLMERTRLQPSTLRHHLRPMAAAGLVVPVRRRGSVFHRLNGAEMLGVTSGVGARLSAVAAPAFAA